MGMPKQLPGRVKLPRNAIPKALTAPQDSPALARLKQANEQGIPIGDKVGLYDELGNSPNRLEEAPAVSVGLRTQNDLLFGQAKKDSFGPQPGGTLGFLKGLTDNFGPGVLNSGYTPQPQPAIYSDQILSGPGYVIQQPSRIAFGQPPKNMPINPGIKNREGPTVVYQIPRQKILEALYPKQQAEVMRQGLLRTDLPEHEVIGGTNRNITTFDGPSVDLPANASAGYNPYTLEIGMNSGSIPGSWAHEGRHALLDKSANSLHAKFADALGLDPNHPNLWELMQDMLQDKADVGASMALPGGIGALSRQDQDSIFKALLDGSFKPKGRFDSGPRKGEPNGFDPAELRASNMFPETEADFIKYLESHQGGGIRALDRIRGFNNGKSLDNYFDGVIPAKLDMGLHNETHMGLRELWRALSKNSEDSDPQV